MTNAASHRPIPSLTWRGKSPGFNEFNAILNIFDYPVLLIDLVKNQIIGANSKLFSLIAFTQVEVIGSSISLLFPEVARFDLISDEILEMVLARHNREPMKVYVQRTPLDSSNQWMVITITPQDVYQQAQIRAQWEQNLLKSFVKLANLGLQQDLSLALSLAIDCGESLFNASLISIYSGKIQYPQLQKIATSETDQSALFPENLTSTELVRLQSPTIWKPGRKVTSELQRIARVANLQYLATLPLGQSGALVGLLVIGDSQTEPFDDFLALMEIFGANLTAIIERQILMDNISEKIRKSKKALAIQSCISENAREGIIILNNDLTIAEMNPSAEFILGYSGHEVLGQLVDNIIIGTDTLTSALKSALRGIPTKNLGNLRLHRRDGHAFPAHLQTIPVMVNDNAGDELNGIIIFISDLSENEQIRVQTQQLEQRAVLGEVTAIFAHEVRNPINNISTGLQLLSINLGAENPNHELIGRLENDCNRLTGLMESVLSFSRPMEYKSDPIDLALFLKRILDRWGPRLARVNVQPFFSSAIKSPEIIGDTRALEQVFTNLINNAVHAMKDSGGTLAIKIARGQANLDPPQLEITVSDTGTGIPDEIRDQIFKPFVTTSPEGTGLGLAITQRIVTAHHGGISVSSFPGGTVFTISLPEHVNEGL